MYADRAKRFSPAGAGAALAVNGALIAGLIFAFAPVIVRIQHPDTTVITIPPETVPPPEPQEKPKTETAKTVTDPYVPPEVVPVTHTENTLTGTTTIPDQPIVIAPPSTGETPLARETPAPPPPLIGANIDPRYARDFQPDYPAINIRSGIEGTATVRVLIGIDGRVKSVEQVSATHPAFYEATRRQALSRWRFKPATRGGVPQESWKTMTVRFVLSGDE